MSRLKFVLMVVLWTFLLSGQQRPPLVRSWTIHEVGSFKKIPTATLRQQMIQRGVLFSVDEPYDQNKVDGTMLLLKQLYRDQGVTVMVRYSKTPVGTNSVKVEYIVDKVVMTGH